jgi:hypothetical protein
MSAVRVGDSLTLHDGTTAVVQAIRCNQCESRGFHDDCVRWAKVGERRWVSLEEER